MRAHRVGASTLLLLPLILVVAGTPALGQVQLGTLPGLTASQARVGTAIDIVCPKLSVIRPSLNSAQLDLSDRCNDMKGGRLRVSELPDVLAKVTSGETSTQGTGAIETRSTQLRSIGSRLAALRLGTTGLSLGGLNLDDGRTVSVGQLLGLDARGGGASADSDPSGRLGAFVNGVGSFGNKNATANEAGFDFHTVGVTAGADYRITDNLVAGLALSYLRTDADITFALGEVDSNSYGVSFYGTYYVGPFYVDVLSGFTRYDYDTTRRIVYGAGATAVDRTAKGDTDGWQYTFNGGAGYDFRLGATTLTPYVRVEYLHLDIDGYTERGANGLDLQVRKQIAESLLTVLGGRVAHAVSTPFGVFVPQLHGEWRHELLDDKRSISAKFVNDPFGVFFTIPTENPDRDYFALGAGVSSILRKGVAAFVDYEAVLGLRDVTSHNFTAGVRIEF